MWQSEWNTATNRRLTNPPVAVWNAAPRAAAGSRAPEAATTLAARLETLRTLDLFRDCSDGERQRLAAASQLRRVVRGRAVAPDRSEHGCFVLVRGFVKTTVARDGMDGELIVDVHGAGDIVDESCWSAQDRERIGEAVAVMDCSVLAVSRRTLREVVETNARVASRLLQAAADRHARALALAAQNARFDIADRLYCRLAELAHLRGVTTRAGIVIDHGLTQGELAAFTNASRENTNRRLSAWRRNGWIVAERRTLRVADPDALGASVGAEARRVGFGAGDGRRPLPKRA